MPSISSASITTSRYGPAAEEIQKLLERADRAAEALNSGTPVITTPGQIKPLIQTYLERLATAGADIVTAQAEITLVVADPAQQIRFGQGADPEVAWGPEWVAYREAVRHLRCRLTDEVLSDSVRRGRIVPPLWPVVGQPAICGEPRIARDTASTSPVPWLLLCELENALSDALLWAVARSDPEGNPFRYLLDLGSLGLAPIGLQGDRFFIYVPDAAVS